MSALCTHIVQDPFLEPGPAFSAIELVNRHGVDLMGLFGQAAAQSDAQRKAREERRQENFAADREKRRNR